MQAGTLRESRQSVVTSTPLTASPPCASPGQAVATRQTVRRVPLALDVGRVRSGRESPSSKSHGVGEERPHLLSHRAIGTPRLQISREYTGE